MSGQEETSSQRCQKSSSVTPVISRARKALTPQDVDLWQLRATPKVILIDTELYSSLIFLNTKKYPLQAASDNGAETLIEALNILSKVVSNLDNSVKRLQTENGGVVSRLDNCENFG